MRIILKIICLLPLALPVTFILIRWPLVFAVVGVSGCVLALIVMAVQIVTSGDRYEPEERRVSAPVDASEVQSC